MRKVVLLLVVAFVLLVGCLFAATIGAVELTKETKVCAAERRAMRNAVVFESSECRECLRLSVTAGPPLTAGRTRLPPPKRSGGELRFRQTRPR